jgi:hypothetical protein
MEVPKILAKILRWMCLLRFRFGHRMAKKMCDPYFLFEIYKQAEDRLAQNVVVLILLRIVSSKKASKHVQRIVSDFLIKKGINPVDRVIRGYYEQYVENQPDSGYLRHIYVHLLHYATALIERDRLYFGEHDELLENMLTPFTMMMWETIFPSCFNVETPVSDLERVYNIMVERWNSRSYVRSTDSGVWEYMHNVVKEKYDTFEGSEQDKYALLKLVNYTKTVTKNLIILDNLL